MTDRYVVLGLAQVRSAWFSEVSRWATTAVVPLDFVKCVSIEELRAHLASGRAFSAVLIDAGLSGLDRDLVELARDLGSAVVLVENSAVTRDVSALGVSAVLPHAFDRSDLLATLDAHAASISAVPGAMDPPGSALDDHALGGRGHVIAITGAGGTGTSVAAMALSHGLADANPAQHRVLLADLALDADQAMLHDARDIVPSVQELVDAFRHGTLDHDQLLSMTFGDGHRYRVLLGLRRHRDWTALRPRAWYAAFDHLRQAFTHVIADIDPDVEGEAQCGSFDVEERNLLARSVTSVADVVVVTGHSGVQGLHRMVKVIAGLIDHGVPPERLLPVIGRAPRSPRLRAEISHAVAELTRPTLGAARIEMTGPVFLPDHRRLDHALRDGLGPPSGLVGPLTAAVAAVLDHRRHEPIITLPSTTAPVPVAPGSLGSWASYEDNAG